MHIGENATEPFEVGYIDDFANAEIASLDIYR